MNEHIHQAIWAKSIDRCIAHIGQVRDEMIRDYAGPYAEDAMPEYPADGIKDSLCRVTPDFMKESADDIILYLEKLRDATRRETKDERDRNGETRAHEPRELAAPA